MQRVWWAQLKQRNSGVALWRRFRLAAFRPLLNRSRRRSSRSWRALPKSLSILQILDYVVDAVRWVATWLAWLATVAAMFIFVIDIIALVVTGGAGSVAAILSAPVFAVLGGIVVVAGTVAFLLYLINLAIEWLESLVHDQRAKFCGKGLPGLPDWDPGGYPPVIPSGDSG